MRHKRYIFLFILTVSVSLLVIGCVYNVISGKPWYANIMVQFFLNLPLCIGLGFIDFGVINLIYKRLKQRNNAVRILVDIVLTTALAVLLTYILNFLLMGGHGNFWHILRNSLPVVPWNWIIVLQIEIFFYSLQRSEMEKQMAVIEKEKALYQFEVLKKALDKFVQEIEKTQKQMQQPKTYRGKQSIKHLMSQNAAISNIEVTDGNIKSFERTASKYGLDFALKKDVSVEPPSYLVFFKGRDVDVMTAAFKEFSAKTFKQKEQPSIRHKLDQEKAQSKAQHKEKVKVKTKDRGVEL